jgi:hypothetical protein
MFALYLIQKKHKKTKQTNKTSSCCVITYIVKTRFCGLGIQSIRTINVDKYSYSNRAHCDKIWTSESHILHLSLNIKD